MIIFLKTKEQRPTTIPETDYEACHPSPDREEMESRCIMRDTVLHVEDVGFILLGFAFSFFFF